MSNTETKLGKISSVSFGIGGYQDAMIGLSVTLEGKGWGVSSHNGFWSASTLERSEHARWTEDDRNFKYAEIMRHVDELLHKAKKNNVVDLRGVPVEATFEGNTLKSWRILTEVL